MSSGFVSGGTIDQPVERDEEWLKAQQEIEANRRRKEEESRQEGGKTLYEVLQANKAAKQEAFEESIRLKNQFRTLDEDEVEFLDSVMESTRAKEAELRKQTTEQLDMFRKQQEEAEKAALVQPDTVEAAVEEENWVTNGKKRKKGKDKAPLKGVKLRKASTGDKGSLAESTQAPVEKHPENDTSNGGKSSAMVTPKVGTESTAVAGSALAKEKTLASKPVSQVAKNASPQPAPAGLGLAGYSSDSD